MSLVPSAFKFLIPWFSNDAQAVSRKLNDARAILNAILEERRQIKGEAKRMGKTAPKFDDMLEWLEEESQGDRYDPATYQMLLSFAAIHTSSDLLSDTMVRLANEPHLISEIREEIVQVISTEGLTKAALSNLKLMDSALKETQRIKPGAFREYP
jgi:cytochrome P450